MAIPRIARRHRRRRIAMNIRDDSFPSRFQLADDVAQSPDDLTDNFVQSSTYIEIEIGLDAEFLQHPAAQILIIVLAGVTEHNKVSPLLQFFVQRNLLDDVWLRGNEDEVDVPLIMLGTFIIKILFAVADFLHAGMVAIFKRMQKMQRTQKAQRKKWAVES